MGASMSDQNSDNNSEKAAQWVKKLSHEQLLVLSGVMQELNAVT
ncbi:MAG: hypothetical protein ACJAYG_001597 [Oceanicoccus sp.]|jgi:hypothetical protein